MITHDMTIEDIIRLYPTTIPVFKKFGLECMECQISAYEALRHGAEVHNIDVEQLLLELNRAAAK